MNGPANNPRVAVAPLSSRLQSQRRPRLARPAARWPREATAARQPPRRRSRTSAKEVAPIIRAKCASCHRLGGIAPFAFRTEADVATPGGAHRRRGRRRPDAAVATRHSVAALRRAGRANAERPAATRPLLRWAQAQLVNPGAPRKRTPVGAPPALPAAGTRPASGFSRLTPATPYLPVSRNKATDDYRCFLLDPGLTEDSFVTSTRIEPGRRVARPPRDPLQGRAARASPTPSGSTARRPDRAGRASAARASARPAASGATGFLDSAGWISAWAPGSRGDRQADGTGVLLTKGSRVVMQVHYNLLNGIKTDLSRGRCSRPCRRRRA